MNKEEATTLLRGKINELRAAPYQELVELIGKDDVDETLSASGKTYYLEATAFWDDRRRGHVRVVVSIDDGGFRAYVPLTSDFIVDEDGHFIGESDE